MLDIIKHALLTRITAGHVSHNTMRQTIEETISALVRSFRGAEPTHLFLCLDDILDGVPSWVELLHCINDVLVLTVQILLGPWPW